MHELPPVYKLSRMKCLLLSASLTAMDLPYKSVQGSKKSRSSPAFKAYTRPSCKSIMYY